MGEQPEEVELGEPSLLQHVSQATTLNRTQASPASSDMSVHPLEECAAPTLNPIVELLAIRAGAVHCSLTMCCMAVQRLYGFATSLALALLFGFMVILFSSTPSFSLGCCGLFRAWPCLIMPLWQASLFFLNPKRFAILYTLSNILMIGR